MSVRTQLLHTLRELFATFRRKQDVTSRDKIGPAFGETDDEAGTSTEEHSIHEEGAQRQLRTCARINTDGLIKSTELHRQHQDPLPNRNGGKHMVSKVSRRVSHPSPSAR